MDNRESPDNRMEFEESVPERRRVFNVQPRPNPRPPSNSDYPKSNGFLPEGLDFYKIAVLGLLALILLLEIFLPRTTNATVELSPNLNTSVNPTFSPSNYFNSTNDLDSILNTTVYVNYTNTTITPSGAISWNTQNVTILQQMVNLTNNITNTIPMNSTDLKCGILYYINNSNSTPCLWT